MTATSQAEQDKPRSDPGKTIQAGQNLSKLKPNFYLVGLDILNRHEGYPFESRDPHVILSGGLILALASQISQVKFGTNLARLDKNNQDNSRFALAWLVLACAGH